MRGDCYHIVNPMQEKFVQPLCPFCDPTIESATFAATEHFRAVYNISPILPGHSLVMPRRHVESLLDLTDSEASELMLFARKVVQTLLKAFQGHAFDWTIQEGVEAGQSLPHLHLHLIPRKESDLPQPGDWYPVLMESLTIDAIDSEQRPKLSREEMDRIVSHLRAVREEVNSRK